MIKLFAILLATLLAIAPVDAQIVQFSGATPNIIPVANDTSANWTKAGLAVIGGIPTGRSQCGSVLNPSGLTPPVANDDAALLVAKIAACAAGTKIVLGTGTFNYAQSELPIVVNKGLTISGSGATTGTCNMAIGTACWGTILQTYDGPQPTYNVTAQCGVTIGTVSNCPNGSGMFLVAPNGLFNFGWSGCAAAATNINPTTSNCGTLLAADVAQGATTVQVASTTNLTVGSWALIDEDPQMISTVNPTGGANIQASAEFLNTSASPAVMKVANPDAFNCSTGLDTYSFCTNRVNEEIHLISSVGAGPCPGVNCTLTFDSPLTLAFRQTGSHDARVYWPTQQSGSTPVAFLQQAGFENLTINRANGGGINFQFCANCWVKNIEVNYWIGGAVNTTYAARVQITGSYLHDCIDCQNNGQEYPIGVSTASTEVLIDNNIIVFGGKGMVGRAANTAVVAYNYVDKTFYEATSIGDYWNDMGLNGSHFGGTHHFLFEGNWGSNCDGDETHGNAIYHTFFRNQCNGMRTSFVDPSNTLTVNDCAGTAFSNPPLNTAQTPAPLRAAGPMAFNYWYAYAFNVMGFSGIQSCAVGAFTYGGNSAGATANKTIWHSGWTGAEWPGPDANLDGVSNAFIFKNGNFDYVNSSVVDFATGFAHSASNSLYLSSTPSYFSAGASCTYTYPWIDSTSGTPVKSNSCSGSSLPAKARFDAGTPFVQP